MLPCCKCRCQSAGANKGAGICLEAASWHGIQFLEMPTQTLVSVLPVQSPCHRFRAVLGVLYDGEPAAVIRDGELTFLPLSHFFMFVSTASAPAVAFCLLSLSQSELLVSLLIDLFPLNCAVSASQ